MDNLTFLLEFPIFIVYVCCWDFEQMVYDRAERWISGEQILVLPKLIVDAMEADPLLSRLHITDIGYFPKALHHRRERKAPINQFVFIYCITTVH